MAAEAGAQRRPQLVHRSEANAAHTSFGREPAAAACSLSAAGALRVRSGCSASTMQPVRAQQLKGSEQLPSIRSCSWPPEEQELLSLKLLFCAADE